MVWSSLGERDSIFRQAELEAGTTLDMLEATHANAMLNRQNTEDFGPVVKALNDTMKSFSETSERVNIWLVMGEKVIAFQRKNKQIEIENPRDSIDQEALNTSQTIIRRVEDRSIRVSRPAILGQGSAADERCASCHTALMDIEAGETLGVYSAAVDITTSMAAWRQQVVQRVCAGIGILLIVLFVIYRLLHTTVIHPVIRLVRATKSVKAKDFVLDNAIADRNDVIGDLAYTVSDFHRTILEKQTLVLKNLEASKHAAAAQAANEAKSDFLSMMSHELRTPMNAMLGSAQLLGASELSEEQSDHVKTMLDGGDILITVLNDILDFSKIEAGKLDINPIDINISDLVKQLERLWQPKAKEANIELICTIDEAVPPYIHIDGTRLRQVLFNLISNAIKFTPKGKVCLNIILLNQKDGVATLRFDVTDTGIGISGEAQARLFTAFEQADGSTTRRFGGSGLGLAISRKFTRLMGGDIHVKSVEGEGSCFTVELDAPVVTSNGQPREEAEVSPVDEIVMPDQRLSLLAAEDNEHNRRILAAFLKPLDVDLIFAEDGEDALQQLQSRAFDVVLMDIQMPKMDGTDVVKLLRKQEGPNQFVPVIALTANAVQGAREKYLSVGMDDYVTKPIDLHELHAAIANAAELERHIPVDGSKKTA